MDTLQRHTPLIGFGLLFGLAALIPARAELSVAILTGSDSSTLNLQVTGTVESYGTDSTDDLFLFVPGVDWANGALGNSLTNVSLGAGHTAPVIENGDTYSLGSGFDAGDGNSYDRILIRDLTPDIQAGDVFDATFTVRNFGISNYSFQPILDNAGSFQAQAGEGTVVPEPGVYAAAFGLLSLGWVFLRRRRARA